MKTVLMVALSLALGYAAQAQGNLQFNQVLYLSSNADNQTQWTVPAGKVWKMESVGVASSSSTYMLTMPWHSSMQALIPIQGLLGIIAMPMQALFGCLQEAFWDMPAVVVTDGLVFLNLT